MTDLTREAASAFVAAAGLELDEVSGTKVVGHIDLSTDHHTPWGVVHGGVYTTAVESAASIGASTAVADRGEFAVGVHNGTDFLRARTEGRVDVVAVPIQQGRVQQLWSVVISATDDGVALMHVAAERRLDLILEALHALPVRQRDRIVAAAPGLVELATAVRESDLEDDR